MLVELQKERERMQKEMVAAQQADYLRIHTRLCPECDTMAFIPEDDYLCEVCRSTGD